MESKTNTCSICRSSTPKYRCPRCPQIRTCSLPCYKRHQQRASCTGQRNATTFLKKSQVTTAAAIDHDYNFLTNIERALSHGHQVANPFQNADSDGVQPNKRRKVLLRSSAFSDYLAKNNIRIEQAPESLHRAKTNATRISKNKSVVSWTVDWIDAAGHAQISQVNAGEQIGHEWARMMARSGNQERKRQSLDSVAVQADPLTVQEDHDTVQVIGNEPALNIDQDVDPGNMPNKERRESGTSAKATQATRDPHRTNFYLHVPQLGRDKALAHVMPTQTLTEALQGRTILEFPTIYHLPYAPGALPLGMTLAQPRSSKAASSIPTDAIATSHDNLTVDDDDSDDDSSDSGSSSITSSQSSEDGDEASSTSPLPPPNLPGNANGQHHNETSLRSDRAPGWSRGYDRGHSHSRGRGQRGRGFFRGGGGRGNHDRGGRGGWRGGRRGGGRGGGGGVGHSRNDDGADRQRIAEQAAAAAAADKKRILGLLRRDVSS